MPLFVSPTRNVFLGSGTDQPELSLGSSDAAGPELSVGLTVAIVLLIVATLVIVVMFFVKRQRRRTAGRPSITETVNMTNTPFHAIEVETKASPCDTVESFSASGATSPRVAFGVISPLRMEGNNFISVRGLGGESSVDYEAELLGALPGAAAAAAAASRTPISTCPADLKIFKRQVVDTSDASAEPHTVDTVEHISDRKLRAGHITKDEHEHIMKMYSMMSGVDDDDAGPSSPPTVTLSWL